MSAFLEWWQYLPYKMNPEIFSIGGLSIRWYSAMYLVAFGIVYLICLRRIETDRLGINKDTLADIITSGILGVIIGGRLGYVLFYGFSSFMKNPMSIIMPFAKINGEWVFTGISGMSFHGGYLGVMIAFYIFSRKHKLSYLGIGDLITAAIPLGYMFGRIGNFINGELYGRITQASIGMIFPSAGDGLFRHPTQLYEAFFEGIVLFAILSFLRKKERFQGFLSGAYIFGYGFFRFFIEYFRQPDEHLGFIFLNFTMGQILCFGMMLIAIGLWVISYKLDQAESN